MQAIARFFKNPILAMMGFVLASILWVRGVGAFVGPWIGGMFTGIRIRTDTPSLALEKLECPFVLDRDGQGRVVATVANPYYEIHRYEVEFYVSAVSPQFWQEDYREQQDVYQEYVACRREIRISPKQTAKASCMVNRPEIETDSVNVTVYAYSDHDTAGGMWGYESSYRGFCTIQSGRLTISPAQAHALLSSVVGLLGIGSVLALWRSTGTINRTIVTIVGLLLWGLTALFIAVLNAYLAVLFLLVTGVVIASVLWIACRMQKNEAGLVEYEPEQNGDGK